ncbi:Nucleolar complex protein 3-like [Holothuria leucospilota]|uniref:Nucleolar complex protein 3 homolog n=1 Tax=Holothuria leucospilota TaxID=206669 RepID=A0A9Q1BFG2_HOLLE|nr:Nucleolar complex protein 3-like [Holothuria leucospilota]
MGKRVVRAATKSGKAKLSNIKRHNIKSKKKTNIAAAAANEKGKYRKGSYNPKQKQTKLPAISRQSRFKQSAKSAGKWPQKRRAPPVDAVEDEKDEEEEEESEVDEEYETLQEEDLEYLKKTSGTIFLAGIDTNFQQRQSKKSRKSERRDRENVIPDFEMNPRLPEEGLQEEVKMKQLLPIKDDKGLKKQWTERVDTEEQEEKEEKDAENEETEESLENTEVLPVLSTVQLFAERQRKIASKKQEIASLASMVIEDPEKYVLKLKTLRSILRVSDPDIVVTVRKLGMVSLTEVFKDIIPGYRVRDWTEETETVQLSKEVKKKREFEENLLSNYKQFLEFLERTVTDILQNRRKSGRFPAKNKIFEMSGSAKQALAVVGCRCLCDLLLKLAHFNYRTNIISIVVAMMFFKNRTISDIAIDCIRRLFAEHKVEDGIPDAVSFISKKIKGQNFQVKPKILDTFLCLRIKETNLRKEESLEEKKKRHLERKQKMNKMSRSQKRYQKQMEVLEKEQMAAEQKMGEKKTLQLSTEIIQSVFATYFRVLKTASDSSLLPSVLEGLAKFAHLINIEFFDDLIKVLNQLIASGVLEYRESLHCVLTAFKILSDQGGALNIDPTKLYTHLYVNLFKVHAGKSSKDAAIILECMDAMVFKRHKQITTQRVLAYIKRMGTLSLQSLPNACLAFLCTMRAMLKLYPKSDILLDTESMGSGVFLPELEEPEHCHAQNTVLWELHLLKNHFHPTIKPYATNLLMGAPIKGAGSLDTALSRRKPMEYFEDFDTSLMTFNPPVLTKPLQKVKRSKTFHNRSFDEFLQPDFQGLVDNCLSNSKEESTLDFYQELTGKSQMQGSNQEGAGEGESPAVIKEKPKLEDIEGKKSISKLAEVSGSSSSRYKKLTPKQRLQLLQARRRRTFKSSRQGQIKNK